MEIDWDRVRYLHALDIMGCELPQGGREELENAWTCDPVTFTSHAHLAFLTIRSAIRRALLQDIERA
jgi:hypothetical protein